MPLSEPSGAGRPEAGETAPSAAPREASVELEVDSELQPGTLVGEYRVESKLGQGGMASVYAGTQPVIGKKVAIKVMSRQLCLDPVQVERFVQEARAVNRIGHPNIVDVFALGTLPDGRSYFVMEWLPGETLAARLRRGRLAVPEAVAIMFQICDGLAAAHDKSIVHRDLKPENLFLVPVRNRRMLVKILDFGIAKLLGARDARVDRTAQGSTPGTPSYMSPEQARGKDLDHRTDIYSLGVTAFEMLLGRQPFVGSEVVDILYQHIHAVPPAPSTLRPDIPLQLERLLLQMLEKKPDRRPTIPVIEERLADLRDGALAAMGETGPFPLRALEMDSGPIKAVEPSEPTDDVVTVARSGPPRALIAATAALLAVALAGVALKLRGTPPAAPTSAAATATPSAPPTAVAAPLAAPPTAIAAPLAAPPTAIAAPLAAPAATAPRVTPTPAAHASPIPRAPAAAPPVKSAPHRRGPRRTDAERRASAPPAVEPTPNRDYMIDPFAKPKK